MCALMKPPLNKDTPHLWHGRSNDLQNRPVLLKPNKMTTLKTGGGFLGPSQSNPPTDCWLFQAVSWVSCTLCTKPTLRTLRKDSSVCVLKPSVTVRMFCAWIRKDNRQRILKSCAASIQMHFNPQTCDKPTRRYRTNLCSERKVFLHGPRKSCIQSQDAIRSKATQKAQKTQKSVNLKKTLTTKSRKLTISKRHHF